MSFFLQNGPRSHVCVPPQYSATARIQRLTDERPLPRGVVGGVAEIAIQGLLERKKLSGLIHYGHCWYDPERFRPVKNKGGALTKAYGGLWASPANAAYGWRRWCINHDREDEWLTRYFTFDYTGNVLTIDSLADAKMMPWCRVYPDCFIQGPDFEAMLKAGVDAIYLTAKGELDTRYSHPENLDGWDCECVLIMNPEGIRI